jgi:predicted DNA-binding transcriptional regulator AlpA
MAQALPLRIHEPGAEPPATEVASIDAAALVPIIRQAVVEALAQQSATPAAPPLLDQQAAWKHLGLSRSAWFRAKSAGKLPRPVTLNGLVYLRRADLDAMVGRLRPAR